MSRVTLTADTSPRSIDDLNRNLARAVIANHRDGVRQLIAAGANPNATRDGTPVLHLAATHAPQVVDLLLELGADVDLPDAGGLTLLGQSVGAGEVALRRSRFWIERGASPAHPSNAFVLHHAAFSGDPDMIDLLLDHGADASRRNGRNETAEDLARQQRHRPAVIDRLHRARVEQEQAVLHEAIRQGPSDVGAPLPRVRL